MKITSVSVSELKFEVSEQIVSSDCSVTFCLTTSKQRIFGEEQTESSAASSQCPSLQHRRQMKAMSLHESFWYSCLGSVNIFPHQISFRSIVRIFPGHVYTLRYPQAFFYAQERLLPPTPFLKKRKKKKSFDAQEVMNFTFRAAAKAVCFE